jgi:hypothetical protein
MVGPTWPVLHPNSDRVVLTTPKVAPLEHGMDSTTHCTTPRIDLAIGLPDKMVRKFQRLSGHLGTTSKKFTVFGKRETSIKNLGQGLKDIGCVKRDESEGAIPVVG